jgi:molybdopterin biosynthesis enzyme MoaB
VVTGGRRALVITVSTSTAAGERDDASGPLLRDGLAALGLAVDGPQVVADGDPGRGAGRSRGHGYALVVTTGGTGLTRATSPRR